MSSSTQNYNNTSECTHALVCRVGLRLPLAIARPSVVSCLSPICFGVPAPHFRRSVPFPVDVTTSGGGGANI